MCLQEQEHSTCAVHLPLPSFRPISLTYTLHPYPQLLTLICIKADAAVDFDSARIDLSSKWSNDISFTSGLVVGGIALDHAELTSTGRQSLTLSSPGGVTVASSPRSQLSVSSRNTVLSGNSVKVDGGSALALKAAEEISLQNARVGGTLFDGSGSIQSTGRMHDAYLSSAGESSHSISLNIQHKADSLSIGAETHSPNISGVGYRLSLSQP